MPYCDSFADVAQRLLVASYRINNTTGASPSVFGIGYMMYQMSAAADVRRRSCHSIPFHLFSFTTSHKSSQSKFSTLRSLRVGTLSRTERMDLLS